MRKIILINFRVKIINVPSVQLQERLLRCCTVGLFFLPLLTVMLPLSLSSGRGSSSFCSSPGSSNSTVYWIYIVHNISGTRYPKLTAKWVLKGELNIIFLLLLSGYLITKNYTTVHEICPPEFGKK